MRCRADSALVATILLHMSLSALAFVVKTGQCSMSVHCVILYNAEACSKALKPHMLLSGVPYHGEQMLSRHKAAASLSLMPHTGIYHNTHSYPLWHLRRGSKPETPLVCFTVSVTTPTAVLLMPTLPCRAEGTTSEHRGPCSTAVAKPSALVCPPAKLAAYT